MKTMISSLTGCLFLFIGLAAVLIMLFLKGRSGHKIRGSLWIRTHRLCGYSFLIIYLLMAAGMVIRISGWREEFSPRVILHILSALVIFPLAGFKILIVRKLKLLSPTLLFLGLTLFSAAFVMNALTAGYYFLHRAEVGFITPEELTSGPLDDKIGRELVIRKCAKCHTLERVFRSFKTEQGWLETVNRMALLDAPNIREFDARQIVFFLVDQQNARKDFQPESVSSEIGESLVNQKCTLCHDLVRVHQAEKSKKEWEDTITRMRGYAGDGFLNSAELKEIVGYLTAR